MDLSNCSSSTRACLEAKVKMYENMENMGRRFPVLTRVVGGVATAASSGILTTAAGVANIGETAIKGLANVYGSPFSEKCSLKTGLKQTFLYLPSSLLGLVLTPVYVAAGSAATVAGMFISPTGYSHFRQDMNERALEGITKC